jgi:signal transduction histidine kinase
MFGGGLYAAAVVTMMKPMNDMADILLRMMIAPTLEETISLALRAITRLVRPDAAGLLLWDIDLGRYIIGEVDTGTSGYTPAQYRRDLLRAGQAAQAESQDGARCVASDVFYQPLNTPDGHHIGALLYTGFAWTPDPDNPDYRLAVRSISRALWTMTRIEQADREHAELLSDRQRLEQLLRAVEQQQRTIDHLLAVERQLSASLEAKVEQRTAALREAQARLIQSEKLAVIGQLASSLAHEINNPLQAVQSGLGLALTEIDSGRAERARGDLEVIQAELERIQTIFRQMLDFYRPVSYDALPLDLNGICEGVRVLLRKKLGEAQVELRLKLAASLPRTCGDSNQIKQVLINLVLNAAEAMPPEGGWIELCTTPGERSVHIRVSDSGGGIDPQHQPHLFEPLFTTKTRGLGLGLAISREIIQRHQGRISVNSAPGQGTTFTVTLPAEDICHDEENQRTGG